MDVWQVEQGLPDSTVTSIVQTPDGYLWFGTFNGLVRFDGVRFTIFDSRTPGLESERVLRLFLDGQGGLWISMEQGQLSRYAGGRFTAFRREDGWVMEACLTRGMALDRSGRMTFLTIGSHLVQFDGKGFRSVALEAIPDTSNSGLAMDGRDGQLWLRHGTSLGQFDDGKWKRDYAVLSEERLQRDNGTMCGSRSGGIWTINDRRLMRLRKDGEVAETIPYPPVGAPVWLEEDSVGQIWACTWTDGLVRIARDGTFQRFSTANGLSRNVIRISFEDREGNVWVGTNGGGLARLKPKVFSRLSNSLDPTDPHLNPIPLSLAADATRRMWVGCLDVGVFSFRADAGDGVMTELERRTDHIGTWAMLASSSGNVWLGTYGRGLGRLSGETTEWWSAAQGLPSSRVLALCEASDGGLWLGTDGGLSRFDGTTFTNYTTADGLLSNHIRALAFDGVGVLWIGSIGGGLNAMQNGSLTSFTRANGLPHYSVRALLPEADGSLWIGTGRGLALLRNGTIFAFNAVAELAESEIVAIVDDGLGYLWFGSNRGVLRIAREDLNAFAARRSGRPQAVVFGNGDGLLSRQISSGQPSALRTHDGRLWFATVNGLSVVDPKQLHPNRLPPPVAIEEVAIDGHPITDSARSGAISVPPGPRRLEFHYTGLSLAAPERVRFRRKLEGFDVDWQDVGTERVASYSGLPPRHYRFRVIAANNDGVWNTEGASLAFVVQPAMWQTLWFRALVLVALAVAVLAFNRRRMNQVELRRAQQEAFSRRLLESQEAERRRIAAELHDSLGQNLSLVKNLAVMGQQGTAAPSGSPDRLAEISTAASRALDEVHAISYALRPPELDRLGLAKALVGLLHRVEEASGIRFERHFELDGALPPGMDIQLFRIAQEAVNNLMKHSGAKSARVELWRDEAGVHLVVADDGHGFVTAAGANSNAKTGLGLAGIDERVRLLGGRHELVSQPGKGTTLSVLVPLAAPDPTPDNPN